MKSQCPKEGEVLAAIRSGEWEASLRAHLGGCPVCQEVAQVAGWMVEFARVTDLPLPGADPERLWSRAKVVDELLQGQTHARRAARPVLVSEVVAASALVVGGGAWLLRSLLRTGGSLGHEWLGSGSLFGLDPVWSIGLVLGGVLPLLAMGVVLRLLWSEF